MATGSRQTRDEPGADRIAGRCEHDGDRRCRLLCCERRWGVVCENESDLSLDEFGCDFAEPLSVSLAPAIVNNDIAALAPPTVHHMARRTGRYHCHRSNAGCFR